MLDDAALPLVAQYPADAWELVFGYDQQRLMSDRAGAAIARSVQEAERTALTKEGRMEEFRSSEGS